MTITSVLQTDLTMQIGESLRKRFQVLCLRCCMKRNDGCNSHSYFILLSSKRKTRVEWRMSQISSWNMVLKILGLVYWFHNTKRFEIEIYNIFGNILWNFFSKKPLLFAPIKTVSLIIIYFPESTILKFKKAFFKRKYEKIIWNVDADKLFKDVLTWSYTWHNCNYNFCDIIFVLMTPVLQGDMTISCLSWGPGCRLERRLFW